MIHRRFLLQEHFIELTLALACFLFVPNFQYLTSVGVVISTPEKFPSPLL